MIVILNLKGGIGNQIGDLFYSINYFLDINIKFSIRYCSFRRSDILNKFIYTDFRNLFDENSFKKIKNYISYDLISKKINNSNKIELKIGEYDIDLFNIYIKNYYNKDLYIFAENFFNMKIIMKNIYIRLDEFYPNQKILNIYKFVKNKILPLNYNFIHLRFESDFKDFFGKNNIVGLKEILSKIRFKNDYKIYLACSDIYYFWEDINKYKIFLYKDDLVEDMNLNYEEKAFVDLLIGINSQEFYGNKKSSFSQIISLIKGTKNFYN